LQRRARPVRRRRRTGLATVGAGFGAAACRVGTHKLSNPHAPNQAAACDDTSVPDSPGAFGAAALCRLAVLTTLGRAATASAPVRRGAMVSEAAGAGKSVGGVTCGGGPVNAAKVVSIAGATRSGTAAAMQVAVTGGVASAALPAASASISAAAFSGAICRALADRVSSQASSRGALRAVITEAIFFVFPATDEPPDDLNTLCGVFPAQALGVAFGSRSRHERCLLPHRRPESCKISETIAQPSLAQRRACARIQVVRISFTVRFEIGEFRRTGGELPLPCGKCCGAAAFNLLDGELENAQAFDSFHELTVASAWLRNAAAAFPA